MYCVVRGVCVCGVWMHVCTYFLICPCLMIAQVCACIHAPILLALLAPMHHLHIDCSILYNLYMAAYGKVCTWSIHFTWCVLFSSQMVTNKIARLCQVSVYFSCDHTPLPILYVTNLNASLHETMNLCHSITWSSHDPPCYCTWHHMILHAIAHDITWSSMLLHMTSHDDLVYLLAQDVLHSLYTAKGWILHPDTSP